MNDIHTMALALAGLFALALLEFLGCRAPIRDGLSRSWGGLRAKMKAWRAKPALSASKGLKPSSGEWVEFFRSQARDGLPSGPRVNVEDIESIKYGVCVKCGMYNCICGLSSAARRAVPQPLKGPPPPDCDHPRSRLPRLRCATRGCRRYCKDGAYCPSHRLRK